MTQDGIEHPKRPGGPLKNWELFELKVNPEGKVFAFRDPDGESYFLKAGEELVFIRNEETGDRDPIIQRHFEDWKKDYKSSVE